jgi:hypothetical protein
MSLELLATIAALCSLPAVGPLFPVKHEQLKCQKEYIKCVIRSNPKSDKDSANILTSCVLENKS